MLFLKNYFHEVDPDLIASNKFDVIFISSLVLSPILFLTARGWTNFFLLFLSALSIYKIITHFEKVNFQRGVLNNLWLIATFTGSLIAVSIAQIIRNHWQPSLIDGPIRVFFSVAIFIYLLKKKIDFVKILEYIIPISIIILSALIYIEPYSYFNLKNRFGTKSIDPLTLGQYATLFGFICLYTINIYKRDNVATLALKISGIILAAWISIGAGSRSAWIAIPFLLTIWILQSQKPRQNRKKIFLLAIIFIIFFSIYKFIPIVHDRITLAINEYIAYFSGDKTDTPTGTRISMLIAASWLFIKKPISGYGDSDYPRFTEIQEISAFNSEYLESTMIYSGAHNEIVQSALRSGVFGLISSILMFIVPAVIFYRGCASQIPAVRAAGLVGLCYIVAIFIFGLSTETFNLKYTISFYALMVSALAAQVLRPQSV